MIEVWKTASFTRYDVRFSSPSLPVLVFSLSVSRSIRKLYWLWWEKSESRQDRLFSSLRSTSLEASTPVHLQTWEKERRAEEGENMELGEYNMMYKDENPRKPSWKAYPYLNNDHMLTGKPFSSISYDGIFNLRRTMSFMIISRCKQVSVNIPNSFSASLRLMIG